jgi:predicted dehydrogenase/threonine dehydrogenase-like Zn-dependent dehydrogenase
MKQVFLQKGNVHLHEVDVPLDQENNILVKVHYSFISTGTEGASLSASGQSLFTKFSKNAEGYVEKIFGALKENGVAGTLALIKEKINQVSPLGYSCAGQVISVGKNVSQFRVGDYVACAGSAFAHHADVVTIPHQLAVKIRDVQFLRQASLTTIGAIALQGIRRAQLQIGEKVCVVGLGLIGQITVQLAKLAGCQVIALDLIDQKLALAQSLGADFCFNPKNDNVMQLIQSATLHRGVDTTIITAASSSGQPIQQAMNITRRKGKVVLVGDVKIDFDRDPFYAKEIDFLISCSYGPGRYDPTYEEQGNDYPYDYVRWTENRNMSCFVQLLEEKKINVEPLISYEFNLNSVEQAYECLQQKNGLGIILSYPKTIDISEIIQKHTVKPFVAALKQVRVGFVGAGGFAKVKLLPIVSKLSNCTIHSIIDTNAANAINIARQYSAQRIGNDYRKIIADDDVKAVVISSPHVVHVEQSIDLIKAGKAVFCEKPAAVNFEQLAQLKNFLTSHKEHLYCVDFNRSFSPFIKNIKEVISKRFNPLLINYRINANHLPSNHWIQSKENGGRIIGEACHILELFCFLTDAEPVSVAVGSLNPRSAEILPSDNFSAHISMSDGSSCSLVYTSIGTNDMGKEYMELFFDGKAIIMDDFIELKGYGLPLSFNKKASYQDKGHEALLTEFFKAVKTKNASSPVPLQRIFAATELSLVIDKLARQGGGFELISSC